MGAGSHSGCGHEVLVANPRLMDGSKRCKPKKRAAVAVARKLAVLLHRLWVSGEVYEPLHNAMSAPIAAAA
jgi:hypothetical protein